MARRAAIGADFPANVDGFLVTKLVNVRYLTGFTGSNGALLLRPTGDGTFATDGRYETQAQGEVPDLPHLISRTVAADLAQEAAAQGIRQLGVEAHHLTVTAHAEVQRAAGEQVELVDIGELVERHRTVKDAEELRLLKQACAITDATFSQILGEIRPGVSERELDWRLQAIMREHGAEAPAFDAIVGFGPNSAIPHHQPSDRKLQTGDLVKLDFGARVGGYHADMTRTVVVGQPADWQRELHALVQQVQEQGRRAVRPGAVPGDIDAEVRAAIEAAGKTFQHGLGHGVGLEIHESPLLGPNSTAARLVDRVPVTVEPGVYLPGRGGVRIEDTVVVGPDGAEPLTHSPRDLIEV
jgi:Xaa-Pro aminopeptidase